MKLPVRYDPLDSSTLADPYSVYAELRASEPVHWHEKMQSWVLTRYRDCQMVLQDPAVFATDWRRAGESVSEPWLSLQTLDPPDHGPLRSLFMNALRAQDLEAVGEQGEALVGSLLDGLEGRAEFDLMSEVVEPLALATISELMGIEQPDVRTFAAISDAIVRSMDAGLAPETAGDGIETGAELRKLGIEARGRLSEMVESWFTANPRPGLLAHVAGNRAEVDVADSFVRNTVRVVFQSGYSSIVAGAGNAMLALLENPDKFEAMRDPALLSSGFDELMRYDASVQGTSRIVTEPVVVGSVQLKRGDVVVVLFGAANRDPEKFTRPDEIILDRTPNQHMAFGRGPHTCVGNLFTQVTLQALIKAILRRPTRLRMAGEPLRQRTATMRYLATLPVAFQAAAAT
ncbi:cytochrome P450 [Kitasatospora sp. NPDC087271]|uniref:cytochrome P450 n=1 Tax=Kitasatospora sp. NPDC087271 TaxID=3364067 RepID=UPI0037F10704